MKEKCGVQRSKRWVLIHIINNPIVIFVVKVLASNLLCKMCLDQHIEGEIVLTYLCAEGPQINLCRFLLNELVQDATDAQERG